MKGSAKSFVVIVLIVAVCVAVRYEPHTALAQQGLCDQTVAISVAAAATQTIVAARTGDAVRVCGFVITGDTLATTAVFSSGSTALTGIMRICDECAISSGNGEAILFEGPASGNLTIAAATGAVTGFVRLGQH